MTLWRKSSHSASSANCVEVAWRKSSHSNSTANCVEVAFGGRRVLARDSKNPAPTLEFPESAWRRFLHTP
ncbi:DUF397 domain-containing protein [Saccharothrix coeruleofusca]|uniref:Toxin n=1 Tax=Saccharothrix coeruleofusca TaxID=33919 RepID=A0A918EBR7_9PSEU|nr:DUF397 domain-containing protein [Saccharothrix coeruleofusca]GGP34525.1 toxin [Saccharothrix coeruleofusca]